MYCVKGGFTTQIHIGWRFICGRMTEAEKAVIDQQEGTEGGERPGMTWALLLLYRPPS